MLFLLYIWIVILPFFLILSHVLIQNGINENSTTKTYLGLVFGLLVGWVFIILWYWVLINHKKLSKLK